MPAPGVTLSGVELERLLRGPNGPVARTVYRILTETKELAREKVRPSRVRAGPEYGRRLSLRDSYVVRMLSGGEGIVGSPLPQAEFVEKGTDPHIIEAPGRGPNSRNAKALRFYSQRAGWFVFRKRVHHPGTKAQHILSRSLTEAIRNHLERL